ncbi:MAG: S8 family serine peptidase [Flavobacteriales bacterium]|jgi:serine protease AprX
MNKFLFLLVFFSTFSFSQHNEYLVFLKDKAQSQNSESEGFKDFYDLPIREESLQILEKKGRIINASKWLNAIHFSTTLSQDELTQFPFIHSILKLNPKKLDSRNITSLNNSLVIGDSNSYGNTFEQLEITQTVSCLHDKGYLGQGVTIAVLDAGFPRMDTMLSFRKMRQEGRIIDTWDFEDNASNVFHKNTHGSYVTSIIGAELDSIFVGSAPKANYAFYITEIGRFEKNIEEFNLVLGLERADSIGANICNISLGYRNFDSLQVSYGYPGMDGKTTIAAQGVSIAKRKGMIISVAAGNNGNDGAGSLSSPCDVDSVLCVGAIKFDSTRAGFSSEGPTFDGRIKPEVVTIGEACHFMGLNDTVYRGNGTSFATPLMTGLVACLVQAHPARSNFEVIDALKNNSNRAANPNNIYGWGIPQGCQVDSVLSFLDSTTTLSEQKPFVFNLFPNPALDYITIRTPELLHSISIIQLDGKNISTQMISAQSLEHFISIQSLSPGIYLIRIESVKGKVGTQKLLVQ